VGWRRVGSCGSGCRQHGCDGLNFLPEERILQEVICSVQLYFNGVSFVSYSCRDYFSKSGNVYFKLHVL
jgi:hypothetical protein